jgi:hypothetical protein
MKTRRREPTPSPLIVTLEAARRATTAGRHTPGSPTKPRAASLRHGRIESMRTSWQKTRQQSVMPGFVRMHHETIFRGRRSCPETKAPYPPRRSNIGVRTCSPLSSTRFTASSSTPPFLEWRAKGQGDGRGNHGTVCLFQHQHFPGSRSRRVSRALIEFFSDTVT